MCKHLDIDHLNAQTIDLTDVLEAIDNTLDALQVPEKKEDER